MKKRLKLFIVVIIALTVITLGVVTFNVMRKKDGQVDPEIIRSYSYEQVQAGDEKVNSTDYVQFDAYYLRDLNGDGYAEKLRGTCREVGTSDTLYIDLNVLSNGSLKNAKITIDGKNFYFATAIVKDNVIARDYISNNTKEIRLNEVMNGTQKLITGAVQSGSYSSDTGKMLAIGNDTRKYSVNDNTVTLTGVHVADDGTETPISKTVTLTNDWHGKVTTELYMPKKYKNQEYDINSVIDRENNKLNLNFVAYLKENDYELILSKAYLEGVLPIINGYAPTNLTVENQNAEVTFDSSSRRFTIKTRAPLDEDGVATTTISRNLMYDITAEYPIEAYTTLKGDSIAANIPLKAYYEGYNNSSGQFANPYRSNESSGTISVVYKNPSGDAAIVEITVGDYVSDKNYAVSKEIPTSIYNNTNIVSGQKDEYTVVWRAYTGPGMLDNGSVILKETASNYTDKFLNTSTQYISMEQYVSNTGIYFMYADMLLGDSGYINVYNDQTNQLLHTFTKDDWDVYTYSNPYRYSTPVKHIRVETSAADKNAYLFVYNIKEIDDVLLTTNYNQSGFNSLTAIYSYVTMNVRTPSALYKVNDAIGYANYMLPVSRADIRVSPNYLSTQSKNDNVNITINTVTWQGDAYKWKDGEFVIKYPSDVIEVEVNSASVAYSSQTKVIGVDTYTENGNIYTKIYTSSDVEDTYYIFLNADITTDPRTASKSDKMELYYYNPIGDNYSSSSRIKDSLDINGNENRTEYIGYSYAEISLIASANLVTGQLATNYDTSGSIAIAPQIASVSKIANNGEATVNLYVLNNSANSISEIKIVGKIPYKNNTYQLNTANLGSQYDTTMTSAGITIPTELRRYATVYYSYNENVTEDVNAKKNGWTRTPDDFSKVKSYLIDLGSYVMSVSDLKTFTYVIKLPQDSLGYNQVAYSTHAVYYCLDTDQGKLATRTEPNKLGFRIEDKFNLQISKKEINSPKTIQGVVFSVEDSSTSNSNTGITNTSGIATIKDLYVEKEYLLKELKTNQNYMPNNDETKFIAHYINGSIQIEVLEGGFKHNTTYELNAEGTAIVKTTIEDEVKYNVEVTKTQSGTNNLISGIRYRLTDYGGGLRIYSTNEEGKIKMSLLEPNVEYTLTETYTNGHYQKEPITFVMTRDEHENLRFNVLSGEVEGVVQIDQDGVVPVVRFNLTNEKIPTYSLRITKKETDTNNVLKGTQFILSGENFSEEVLYTTDDNGIITIDNLYEYVDGKEIEGIYTLQEIYATEGYILNNTPIVFRAKRDSQSKLKLEIISGQINEESLDESVPNSPLINITLYNDPLFTLEKVASDTGEPLDGAMFKVSDLDGNSVFDASGNKLDSVVTDSSGKIRLSLVQGLYEIKELRARQGYQKLNTTSRVGIGESKAAEEEFGIVWSAERAYGGLTDAQVINNYIYAVGSYGTVMKYDIDANIIWINREKNYGYTKILPLDDEFIAVASDGSIVKYDLDGNILLEKAGDGNVINNAFIANGAIYTIGSKYESSQNMYICTYSKLSLDGEVIWRNSDLSYNVSKSLILNDGILCCANVYNGGYTYFLFKYDFDGNVLWEKNLDYILNEFVDVGDGFVVAGNNSSYTGCLIKYDLDGNVMWTTNMTGSYQFFYSLARADDGVIVSTNSYTIYKYDSNGNKVWENTEKRYSYGKVFPVEDGAIVSASAYIDDDVRYTKVKYDYNGNIVWENYTESTGVKTLDVIDGTIIVSGNGMYKFNVYGETVTENIEEIHRFDDIVLTDDGMIVALQSYGIAKYDYNGNFQWINEVGKPWISKLILVEDGVIGIGDNGSYALAYINKYDFNGNLVWAKRPAKYISLDDIQKINNGFILIGDGFSDAEQRNRIYGVMRYDLNGNLVWEKTFDGTGYASFLKMAVVGNYILAINSSSELYKFNLNGTQMLKKTISSDYLYPYAATAVSDGIVLITSEKKIEKYDLNGNLVWQKNSSNDKAYYDDIVPVSDGLIAVGGANIIKYDFNGNIIYEYVGRTGLNHRCVATNNNGRDLYVGGFGNNALFKFGNHIVSPEIQETQSIRLVNDIAKYKVVTRVRGVGGDISGKNENPYELVTYKENSTKDIIVTPASGYGILKITINGEEIDFTTDASGKAYLDKFISMTEDKEVVATFYKKDENLIIRKLSTVGNTEIAGAKFSIIPYNDDGVTLNDTTKIEAITGSNGEVIIPLSIRKYQIKEIEVPEEYSLNTTPIDYQMVSGSDNVVTIRNRPKADVIVHHYIKDTTIQVADDDILKGDVGARYTTAPKIALRDYELVKKGDGSYDIPSNATGTYTEEVIVVTYYYEQKPLELIVHHYLDGTEDKVANDDTRYGQKGDEYTTEPLVYPELNERYEVVTSKIPENQNGTFEDTITEVIYYYKLKEFNITTQVDGGGGTISGQGEISYEKVLYDQNSKKNIVIKPNIGYEITSITINGEQQDLPQDRTQEYTLDKFTNVTEDKHIVVSFDVIRGNVAVYKVWNDEDNRAGKRPTLIEIELYNEAELVAQTLLSEESNGGATVTLVSGDTVTNAWLHTFENVPLYDINGNSINYRIAEREINTNELYMYTETIDKLNAQEFITVNTFGVPDDTIDIAVTKIWVDDSDDYGKRPNTVKIQIKNGEEVVREQAINVKDSDSQICEFFGLPEYNENGDVINYTVVEGEMAEGDLKFYSSSMDYSSYTMTNTFTVPDDTIDITVTKVWDDGGNENEKRPDETKLQILDGNEVVKEQVINAKESDTQIYTFSELAKYDSRGQEKVYVIAESQVNEDDFKFYTTQTNQDEYTITNTFTVPEDKISIVVTKVWQDDSNDYLRRPEQVKLILKNGEEQVREYVVDALSDDEQTFEFTDLAKYNARGNEIVYTIDEQEVTSDGLKFYSKAIDNENYIITNTFQVPDEKINLTIRKVWEDEDNSNQTRPENIVVYVKDGERIEAQEQLEQTSSNVKDYTFRNITKYNSRGEEITYTLDEDNIYGYNKNISDLTITNVIKEYRITTQVDGEGGTISGQDEEVYEVVKHNGDSINEIRIIPEEKYKVSSITINGEEISYTELGEGLVILDKFLKVTEDINVIVRFEKKESKITVRYLEVETEKVLADEESFTGKVDDEYNTTDKVDEINTAYDNKYELSSIQGDGSGVFTVEEQTITYWYVKKEAEATARYLESGTETELLNNEEFKSRVDDEYEFEDKIDEINEKYGNKYELLEISGDTKGVLTLEPQVVTYWYIKKEAEVEIRYLEVDTQEELDDSESIKARVDDEYTTTDKIDEINEKYENKYELSRVDGNVSGLLTVEPQVVTYWYIKKEAEVTTRYLEVETELELADSEYYKARVDDDYITTDKIDEINGRYENKYELSKVDGDIEGILTVEPQYVTYWYIKKESKVTIKYLDIETGEELIDIEEIQARVDEEYTTEDKIDEINEKYEDKYEFSKVDGDTEGIITVEPQTVIYWYIKKESEITVRYLEVDTEVVLSEELQFTGRVDEDYETEDMIEKINEEQDKPYELKAIDGEPSGKYKVLPQVITYWYEIKHSKVVIKYIDILTGEEIIPEDIIDGHIGEEYETKPKQIPEYELEDSEGEEQGILGEDEIEVIYYYINSAVKAQMKQEELDRLNGAGTGDIPVVPLTILGAVSLFGIIFIITKNINNKKQ